MKVIIKILSTIIMNKKLSKSINNYMINMANEASNYDWHNDGRRYYRGLRIIRTKDIKRFFSSVIFNNDCNKKSFMFFINVL